MGTPEASLPVTAGTLSVCTARDIGCGCAARRAVVAGISCAASPARIARRASLERSSGQRVRGPARSAPRSRSEEHTSELQSLMRISYAVFCLKKKKKNNKKDAREKRAKQHA